MRNKILGTVASALLAVSMNAHGAVITEIFRITFPVASGPYLQGDVISITATYDDAGTYYNNCWDGPNLIGEFCLGDDSPASPSYGSGEFLIRSNVQFSIEGLADIPEGQSLNELRRPSSIARYWEYRDPSTNGWWAFEIENDYYRVLWYGYGPDHSAASNNLRFGFSAEQYFSDGSSQIGRIRGADFSMLERMLVPPTTSAPEPGTIALLGLGLAGLGLTSMRRKSVN